MDAYRWGYTAGSLWTIAFIIGICQIVLTILPLFMPTAPVVSYDYAMEYNQNSPTIYIIGCILALVIYIAMWCQVSYLGTWLKLMNTEQDNTYTHLNRYKIGLQTVLICIIPSIATILLVVWAMSTRSELLAIIADIIKFGLIIGILVGCIFQIIGVLGMAFSCSANTNMSSGMRLIVYSWVIIVILVITVYIMTSCGYLTIQDWNTIIPFISLINPIIQVIGWREICKAQYSYNE